MTVWATPSGHQVIANHRVVRFPLAVIVIPAGDVVEVAVVAGALADGIDRGVDKTKRRAAIGHGLLIDQREKSGPARCRETPGSERAQSRLKMRGPSRR